MDDMPTTLLVAERDEPLREFLVDQLLADGLAASGAAGLEEARVRLANFQPDLLVVGALGGVREQRGLRARPAACLRGGL
jgi:DNA-binding response OmpR family regulator